MAEDHRAPVTTTARVITTGVILGVCVAYFFFATAGTFEFRRIQWHESLYADLAEGLLRGTVALASKPSAELMRLENPYYSVQRSDVTYIWDSSYYKGRYYLYFSPLPALLFVIPFRLLAGGYPPDNLATAFFATWAFLGAAAFVLRARRGQRWVVPAPFWMAMLGLGGFVPYVLSDARAVYPVAVSCGMAMTAMSAYSLLLYLERPTLRRAALLALWLGLAVAARPNLVVLVAVMGLALLLHAPRERRWMHLIVWLVPLACIAAMLMAYNFVRFRDVFEFGVRYQLGADLIVERICSLQSREELVRFANMIGHHVFQPPTFGGDFPWIDLPMSRVHLDVSPGAEQTAGIGALLPLTIVATVLLVAGYGRKDEAGAISANYLMTAAWIILVSLSTCWFVASRYVLDYQMAMVAATVISLESIMGADRERSRRLAAISVVLIVSSVAASTLLGFSGPHAAFRRFNPALFERISSRVDARFRTFQMVRMRGWAVHVDGPLEITLDRPGGLPTPGARVVRLPSPDVYEHFSRSWKALPALRNARFEVRGASLDDHLVFSFQSRVIERLPLNEYPPGEPLPSEMRLAVDEFQVVPVVQRVD